MNRLRKVALSFLLLTTTFFYSTAPVFAQAGTPIPTVPPNTWYNPDLGTFYDKVVNTPENEMFAERYTFAQVNWIINSLSLLFQFNLLDENVLESIKNEIGQTPTTPQLADYARTGPSGFLILTIADVFKFRPASGVDSISSTLAKFDLASPAHAQTGYGYTHLQGIQFLWSATRNTAYLVIAILLIVAGFMVILRQKVSPQAVVTVQMIIPRLIITLILVTFSYAIAGLVIDLVYFTVAIIIAALSTSGVVDSLGMALYWFANPGFYKIFITYGLGFIAFMANPQYILWAAFMPVIVWLIIGVCMFFLLLRVWWMMMKAYLTMIFLILIGPWFIMLGLLPNSKVGFGSWLRNVIAQASVFVVVPIMFIINLTLYDFNEQFSLLTGTWSAIMNWVNDNILGYGNLTGGIENTLPSLPLFSSPGGSISGFFFSLAILALMPKIADMIRDAIKAPKMSFGSAFGQAVGPARTALGLGQSGASALADAYYRPTIKAGGNTATSIIDALRYAGVLKGKPGP